MPKYKSDKVFNDGRDHVIVYWSEENRYSVLGIKHVPGFHQDLTWKEEDVVGKEFLFSWKKGCQCKGMVKGLGKNFKFTYSGYIQFGFLVILLAES